ncbi:signal peptide containing protein [Babesia caballi]|uniref:Signal peptide containing protein n=1 Tax=Babesia caballi TaxID=5871 RepID=A0AAV4LY13_BABCB|nr:signal peptide containing protein [Babesia caballi]
MAPRRDQSLALFKCDQGRLLGRISDSMSSLAKTINSTVPGGVATVVTVPIVTAAAAVAIQNYLVVDKAAEKKPTLNRYQCSGCGFTIFPAKNREERFFSSIGVNRKLNCVSSRLRAQVVDAGLQPLLPPVEMHAGELAERRLLEVDVERLRLVDEDATVRRHVDDVLLLDLPDGLVEVLDVLRNALNVLEGTVVGDELLLHVLVPETQVHQVAEQVRVDDEELATQHAAVVYVARVGLERLVVAQYLRRGSRGHGRQKEGVAQSVLGHAALETVPVPELVVNRGSPEVELQLALRGRRARVGLIGAVALGQRYRLVQTPVVDGLEDAAVQLLGFLGLEGVAHEHEGVGQTLDTHADGPVTMVGDLGLRHRVVVAVDDLVEVVGDDARNVVELLEVGDGGEVADGHLLRRRVLHDFAAQVGGLDGAQVLLVGLGVARVLVQHEGGASLDLTLEDGEPEGLGGDGLATQTGLLVLGVELLELVAPDVVEAAALVRAHQGPLPVSLDTLHEQVGNPQGVEQIARACLLGAVVLAKVQKVHDVGVPRLHVNGEGALALAASLVHVAGGGIENAQHGHNAVALAVGATNVGATGPDLVAGQPYTPGALADETAGHLGSLRAREEKCGCGVGEVLLAHEVVRLDGAFNVAAVDACRHAHKHVLRALDDLVVNAQQVRALQRLQAEVVVLEVPRVIDLGVDAIDVRHQEAVDLLADQGRVAVVNVLVLEERRRDLAVVVLRVLVEVVHHDARSQFGVVGVSGRHVSARLRRQLVELRRADARVHSVDDRLRDARSVDQTVEAVRQLANALQNAVKLHLLLLAPAVDDVHRLRGAVGLERHVGRLPRGGRHTFGVLHPP